MPDTTSQLEHVLKRIYELDLGFYPDQFDDTDLYDLAFKSDHIRSGYRGKRINMFRPEIGQDGFAGLKQTVVLFIKKLEKAFNIEIRDDEAEKVVTISDLAKLIAEKRKDNIVLHRDYYDSLLKSEKIELLIVGKDPFPTGAMGIPFCKNTRQEQTKRNSSGYYILNGLGVDIDNKTDNPEDIFFDLLARDGIGFINASYFSLKDEPPKNHHLTISNNLNNPIFKKSKQIVVSRCVLDILKKRAKHESEATDNSHHEKLLPPIIDKRFIKVIHPSNHNISRDEHKSVWQQHRGLLSMLNDADLVNDHEIHGK